MRGFSTAAANEVLLGFVREELARRPGLHVLDLGCGAARNAAPMAAAGATVIGTDVAWPMLEAGRRRAEGAGVGSRVAFVRATMDRLPLRDASVDLVVAHGIWNLSSAPGSRRTRPGRSPSTIAPFPGRTLTRGGPVIYEGTFHAVGRS